MLRCVVSIICLFDYVSTRTDLRLGLPVYLHCFLLVHLRNCSTAYFLLCAYCSLGYPFTCLCVYILMCLPPQLLAYLLMYLFDCSHEYLFVFTNVPAHLLTCSLVYLLFVCLFTWLLLTCVFVPVYWTPCLLAYVLTLLLMLTCPVAYTCTCALDYLFSWLLDHMIASLLVHVLTC